MINRLIEPTTGTIEIDGADVTRSDPVKLRRGIGYVIQQIGLFPHQKIVTNVMTVPLLYGESKHVRPAAGQRAARPGRPRPGVVRRPLPAPALRRPAAAGRRGPGAGREPAGAADGRAVRRRRPGGAGPAPGRVPAAAVRAREDRRDGHPRHRRGGPDGRPGRGVRDRRPARAVRHPGRAARPPGRRVRRGLRRRHQGAAPADGHPDRPRAPRADRRGQHRRPRRHRRPHRDPRGGADRDPAQRQGRGRGRDGAQFVGVLTPNGIHKALRASLAEPAA